jgi:hypothetical protein
VTLANAGLSRKRRFRILGLQNLAARAPLPAVTGVVLAQSNGAGALAPAAVRAVGDTPWLGLIDRGGNLSGRPPALDMRVPNRNASCQVTAGRSHG